MAQDIVGSLFGPNPAQIQQDYITQEANRANQYANLNPFQQANYGAMVAGQMGGRAISGLLGAEDPRLQQAKQMQQVKQWIAQSGVDMNTPEGLAQAAQYAQSIGATEGAMFLGQQAMAKRKSLAETGIQEENLQRGQQYRAAVAELQKNPNATEQDYINLARQFATPEAGISAAISAQAKQEAARLKAEADQLDYVTNAEGKTVGKFDKVGRFISTSGVVTPAKDYQAAKAEHEKLQDSLDTLLDISKDDIKNAFGTVNYTKIPGAGLIAPESTYTAQNKINSAQISNVLDSLATMKGATSDAEMNWIKTNFPGYDASPATMEAWMNRTIKYINKKLQRGETQFGLDTQYGNPDLFSSSKMKMDAKKADWMKRAKAVNPTATEQELSDHYDNNKK